MYILNSTELIFHIPDEGIKEKALIKEIMKLRNLSKEEVEKSIQRALSIGTVIKKGDLIKVSPKVKFIK